MNPWGIDVNVLSRGYRIVQHLALLGAILILASACGSEPDDDAQTSSQSPQTTSSEAQNGPEVKVSADKTHAVQPGDEITVTIAVEKFTLDAANIGEPNEAGVGHYRIYLDNMSGDDFIADGAAETIKVKVPEDITDGSHQLRVVLHNNDRSPVSPPATGEVWLIVYRL